MALEGIGLIVVGAVAYFVYRQYVKKRDEELLSFFVSTIAANRMYERKGGNDKEADRLLELEEVIQAARAAARTGRKASFTPREQFVLRHATNPFDLERTMARTGINHLPVYNALMRLLEKAG